MSDYLHADNLNRDGAVAILSAPPPAPGALMRQPVSPPSSPGDPWELWDRFLETTPDTGFMQSSWWADFRAWAGFDHFATILKHNHAILGGAMVQKFAYPVGNRFYYIQEGPVLPQDDAAAAEVFDALLEDLEEHRRTEPETVSHLRIEPRWPCLPKFVTGFRTLTFPDNFVEPRNTLCINLRPSEEAILAQMKPKGRYNIRVARRHGVAVVEDTSDQGLAEFLSIYEETAGRQDFDAKPPDYFHALAALLSMRQCGSIFFAEYQGARIAAALVVYFGRRTTYFFGGSLRAHRNVMAPYLLHFEIMRHAKALGHEWYDLWGLAPPNDPEDPWRNISVFKRKLGGVEVNLVPTLDLVYDPPAYDLYLAAERDNAVVNDSDSERC